MNTLVALVIGVSVAYLAIVLLIGQFSRRGVSVTREGFFLADRRLRGVVLFASIFGTNMTAFVMLGLAGQTYRTGLGSWAMLLGPSVLTLPVLFFLGYRCWLVARRYGYITPVEFYRDRYNSDTVGFLLFLFMVVWTIPYILTGIVGAGRAFDSFTDGTVPYWVGALVITVVVGYYVFAGGMKGTAWTNTLQVFLFLGFLLTAAIWIPLQFGGTGAIMNDILADRPESVTRVWAGPTGWGATISYYVLFSTSLLGSPFIWVRWVSARAGKDIRRVASAYPIVVLLTWGSAILLGLWGASLIPGLGPDASDSIIFAMTSRFLPVWMAAVGLVGLIAIVMSTMDAQTLTMSNMFTLDIVGRYWKRATERHILWLGRAFVVALLAILFAVSLLPLPGIFAIATLSFTGSSALFPTLAAGVLWRRATRQGAIASLIGGQAAVWGGYLGWYPLVGGLHTVFWGVAVSGVLMVAVSLATKPPQRAAEAFHSVWDETWRAHPPRGWRVVTPAGQQPSGSGASAPLHPKESQG